MENDKGVTRFFSSDASLLLEATFENSLVLTDTAGLDKISIEAVLRHKCLTTNGL
jgi:hypothetical protein